MKSDSRPMRLNKYLALCLGISRREADEYIEKGRVKIGNETARLGQQIAPEITVIFDNQPVQSIVAKKYIALNKPVGYVCSRRRQGKSPTIYELLPKSLHHLKPVGRLDKDSSGLILLTNDGDFAHKMTHPKFGKEKVYKIQLNRPLTKEAEAKINAGVKLEDGASKLIVKKDKNRSNVFLLDTKGEMQPRYNSLKRNEAVSKGNYVRKGFYTVNMFEGRNRQIRRTFAALGYKVIKLHRTKFGDFKIDNLQSGKYKTIAI